MVATGEFDQSAVSREFRQGEDPERRVCHLEPVIRGVEPSHLLRERYAQSCFSSVDGRGGGGRSQTVFEALLPKFLEAARNLIKLHTGR